MFVVQQRLRFIQQAVALRGYAKMAYLSNGWMQPNADMKKSS